MIFDRAKQVCIVGGSGNMIGANLGKIIDKQEVVVRFNDGLPEINPKLKKDIGTRTDIYVNRRPLGKRFELLKGKTKCFFSAIDRDNKEFARNNNIELNYLPCASGGFNHKGERDDFIKLWKEINYKGHKMTAGLGFILLCLRRRIPEINICGFTTNKNYISDEQYEFYEQRDNYKERKLKEEPHDFRTERRFISQLIKEKKINYIQKMNKQQEYWSNPDKMNLPSVYLKNERNEISNFLMGFIRKYIKKDEKILELGCNVGRNLNHLFKAGYKKLYGIEINKEAIILLKKTYPDLTARVYLDTIENKIRKLQNNHYVIFTVAVLQHLPPESDWVFKEIVKTTKKHLIIIESEKHKTDRLFIRNYKTIFENLGMKQIKEMNCGHIKALSKYYFALIFIKK